MCWPFDYRNCLFRIKARCVFTAFASLEMWLQLQVRIFYLEKERAICIERSCNKYFCLPMTFSEGLLKFSGLVKLGLHQKYSTMNYCNFKMVSKKLQCFANYIIGKHEQTKSTAQTHGNAPNPISNQKSLLFFVNLRCRNTLATQMPF